MWFFEFFLDFCLKIMDNIFWKLKLGKLYRIINIFHLILTLKIAEQCVLWRYKYHTGKLYLTKNFIGFASHAGDKSFFFPYSIIVNITEKQICCPFENSLILSTKTGEVRTFPLSFLLLVYPFALFPLLLLFHFLANLFPRSGYF